MLVKVFLRLMPGMPLPLTSKKFLATLVILTSISSLLMLSSLLTLYIETFLTVLLVDSVSQPGFVGFISPFIGMFVFDLNLLGLGLLGSVMGASPKVVLLVWFSSLRFIHLGVAIWSLLLVFLLSSMLVISSAPPMMLTLFWLLLSIPSLMSMLSDRKPLLASVYYSAPLRLLVDV